MVTSLYAALLCFLFIGLSAHVIRGRRRWRVAVGDGGNDDLRRRIRAQGNFAEYAPFFVIMMGMAEFGGLPSWALHGLGLVFITARVTHAYAFLGDEEHKEGKMVKGGAWRVRGMILTLSVLGTLGFILLTQFIMKMAG